MKILSLNTWKCDGEYRKRLDYMVKELSDLKPDIIALQECFRSVQGEADTLQFLARNLGTKAVFVPGRYKKRLFEGNWVDSYSDLGILSRLDLSEEKYFELPGVPEDPDRKIQMVKVQGEASNSFLFVNTHLTHLSKIEGLKEAQFQSLTEVIQKEIVHHSFALVGGDFNTLINTENLKKFMELNKALDAYSEGGGIEPRNSLVDAMIAGKHYAVDHIFYIPKKESGLIPKITQSRMVLNKPEPGSGIYPSDHFGLCVELNF